MNEWRPISEYPLPDFSPDTWYRAGRTVLVFDGNVKVAFYSYTRTGKGRWRDWRGVVAPTHWMPLPEPPKESTP